MDVCDGLNGNGPHGLIGSGIIGGEVMLEEMHDRGWALRFQKFKPVPVSLLLPVGQDAELSVPLQHHACLHSIMLLAMLIMD